MVTFTLADFPPFTPEQVDGEPEPDWVCGPCGWTPDTADMGADNYAAALDRFDRIDPYGVDWAIVAFPHFKTRHVEQIFVRPGSRCAKAQEEMRIHLTQFMNMSSDMWDDSNA